jgi:hypothetical protein
MILFIVNLMFVLYYYTNVCSHNDAHKNCYTIDWFY